MLRIEPITRKHNRAAFDCGVECLNTYLQTTARQHSLRGASKTFVLVDGKNPTQIIAYFTTTVCSMDMEALPEGLVQRYPVGLPAYAILLARLAVCLERQGERIGRAVMVEVMQMALTAADVVGGIGLFVEAKDKKAAAFYKKFGFKELTSNPYTLFLPLETIREALSAT